MLLWPVKKEKKLLTDYQICEIDIEKSSTAKYLEQNYGGYVTKKTVVVAGLKRQDNGFGNLVQGRLT